MVGALAEHAQVRGRHFSLTHYQPFMREKYNLSVSLTLGTSRFSIDDSDDRRTIASRCFQGLLTIRYSGTDHLRNLALIFLCTDCL